MYLPSLLRRPRYTRAATGNLAQKSLLAIASRVAPGVATLVTNIAIGRIGGSSTLGLTQTIMSSASLAALLFPAAAGTAASRYIASEGATDGREDATGTIANYLSRQTLIATLLLAGATAIVFASVGEAAVSTVVVGALMVIAVSGRSFVEGLHFGGGEGARLAQWSAIVATGSVVTTIVLLVCGVDDAWVIASLALLNILFVIMSWPRRVGRLRDRAMIRNIRLFMALSVVGSLASAGFAQAAVLVGRFVNGLSYAGQYAAAFTLVAPLMLVASALSAILFPALAAAHRSETPDAIRARLSSATSMITTLLVGAFIVVSATSQLIVSIVWGPEFPLTSTILLILLPAVVVSGIAVPSVSGITSSSNNGMAISAISSTVGALVGVVTWITLGPLTPDFAVPIGYTVGTATIALIPYIAAWRRFRMRWGSETVSLALALALASAVNAWGMSVELHWAASAGAGFALLALWCILRRTSVRAFLGQVRRLCERR